ncbi:acetate--CoA ligase [Bacteriovoracaceae bacterium]|nr:acetate--CoA ligase [Bacteriovoracaceae bacterium]
MDWHIKSADQYRQDWLNAKEDPTQFWADVGETFTWHKKWDNVLSGSMKDADVKWYDGGELNITENCLDRHLEKRGDKVALLFEPNDPNEKVTRYTYKQLHAAVCKTANMLKSLDIKKGDRVCLYMSMVPELMISVLACARIGAIHSVVFGGFSAEALAGRIQDAECSIVITNDAGFRGGKTIPLKQITDEALANNRCPSVKTVLVHKRVGQEANMVDGRDVWWHALYDKASADCAAEVMQAEDTLFTLYTSGSTGKPKGIQHTVAGYMVWAAYTFQNVFQVQQEDTYWCTADIGWVTGHTYITYGPLLNGATTMMFEGVPTWPDAGRFWQVCEKHKVTHFYTAPTAIRALQACGLEHVNKSDLSSLKVLGSVGEPINEEAWHWYDQNIGKGNCPIVDTWWQTETGGIMITPLAGVTPTKPCFATLPLPGVVPMLVDEKGIELKGNDVEGNLCIAQPWPGIVRSIYGDHERYIETYFSMYPGKYFTGDGCKRDVDGDYRILGRVDDVINVSGHRMGTAEVEDAIDQHPNVVESAVVSFPHDIKGQGIYAFIITHEKMDVDTFKQEILSTVTKYIGPIAKPDGIEVVVGLPKTRSGKIMRRILRKIASGEREEFGDISTLLDPSVVAEIIKNID